MTASLTTTKKTPNKKASAGSSTTTTAKTTTENDISDDVRVLLYQCSVLIDSYGQTARALLKAIEQLYCHTVWE